MNKTHIEIAFWACLIMANIWFTVGSPLGLIWGILAGYLGYVDYKETKDDNS